ncbi:MAG: bifunctional oligoribonuclease/PAP phosphatase NrnA [Bacillota bacterium]|nr:bifunctional oligoribonuclease/PAP phosphatase NrnA [Bacillota bacterium]
MTLDNIVSTLKGAEKIAVLPHISIDGDSLGSSLALAMALKKLNKEVKIYLSEEIPYIYSFLSGKENTEIYTDQNIVYDVAVALDCGDMGRLGERDFLFNSAKKTINIDHHKTNTEFAFLNYVDPKSSAVGEIIYQIIKMLGAGLDKAAAECLYVAIATDTGGFRYSNTTALTHQIISELINTGIDVSEISQKVFETSTLRKVKLMGFAIESLELFEHGKVACLTLTDQDMKKAEAVEEDCDGIVNIARNIQGVEVAVMLRQRDNGEVKANLRSKAYVDVSVIAGMFSGGGHKRAAGFTAAGRVEDIKSKLLDDIKEVLYKV